MKIDVLCSDQRHPVLPSLLQWAKVNSASVVRDLEGLSGGDLLFLISCADVIERSVRDRYKAALVIHASDLPRGRGWSPLVWQILDRTEHVAVTLFEAEDDFDSGPIWQQEVLRIEEHEVFEEINGKLFASELRLMDYAVANCTTVEPRRQEE